MRHSQSIYVHSIVTICFIINKSDAVCIIPHTQCSNFFPEKVYNTSENDIQSLFKICNGDYDRRFSRERQVLPKTLYIYGNAVDYS